LGNPAPSDEYVYTERRAVIVGRIPIRLPSRSLASIRAIPRIQNDIDISAPSLALTSIPG